MVWTIPDEAVIFIGRQFVRFNAPYPPDKAIDKICDHVIQYVIINKYYPTNFNDSLIRYDNPGLTEPEKVALLPAMEYQLKLDQRMRISFEQIHLAAWASLLWCWSQEGVNYAETAKKFITQSQII